MAINLGTTSGTIESYKDHTNQWTNEYFDKHDAHRMRGTTTKRAIAVPAKPNTAPKTKLNTASRNALNLGKGPWTEEESAYWAAALHQNKTLVRRGSQRRKKHIGGTELV